MRVNWISVKDRLPEPYVSVFVYGKRIENIFAVGRYDKKPICSKVVPFTDHDFITGDGKWYFYDDITHWAEIEYPDPPEDDEI